MSPDPASAGPVFPLDVWRISASTSSRETGSGSILSWDSFFLETAPPPPPPPKQARLTSDFFCSASATITTGRGLCSQCGTPSVQPAPSLRWPFLGKLLFVPLDTTTTLSSYKTVSLSSRPPLILPLIKVRNIR